MEKPFRNGDPDEGFLFEEDEEYAPVAGEGAYRISGNPDPAKLVPGTEVHATIDAFADGLPLPHGQTLSFRGTVVRTRTTTAYGPIVHEALLKHENGGTIFLLGYMPDAGVTTVMVMGIRKVT